MHQSKSYIIFLTGGGVNIRDLSNICTITNDLGKKYTLMSHLRGTIIEFNK